MQYKFWTVPKGVSLKDVELPENLAGYNTYKVRVFRPVRSPRPPLPPGSGLAPDTKSGYTYFVAIPEGKGAHDFPKSLAKHEKKLKKYGY